MCTCANKISASGPDNDPAELAVVSGRDPAPLSGVRTQNSRELTWVRCRTVRRSDAELARTNLGTVPHCPAFGRRTRANQPGVRRRGGRCRIDIARTNLGTAPRSTAPPARTNLGAAPQNSRELTWVQRRTRELTWVRRR